MGQVIAFWIFAVAIVGAALGVVLLKNVFRAAILLITCFLGVAGIFILLSADFLAAMQILIYVGAIAILVILAIMLTRELSIGSPSNKFKIPALIIAGLFGLGIILTVINTKWLINTTTPAPTTTSGLAVKLFSKDGFILPVEIIPTVLLATILGAIVLIKDKKK
ncbi:MAG: NADH-quinone oxidoreductase subunit J [Dehalococcoidales bacterium]|jgi:NADH-quinone oxidoreductase subunit J